VAQASPSSSSPPARALAPFGVAVFIATTAILAAIASTQVAERKRLEEQYDEAARRSVTKMAAEFERHLGQLAEDARLLADLLWHTSEDPDYPAVLRNKVLLGGVRALSSAVHQCRGVAFTHDGEDFEVAIDPDEDPALADWLRQEGRKAMSPDQHAARLWGPTLAPGDRPFFVQVQRLSIGLVIAAVDARRLFETLQQGRPSDARFLLVDANETLWVGCSSLTTCQPVRAEEWSRDAGLRAFVAARSDARLHAGIPARLRRLLALPSSLDVAVHWHAIDTGDVPLMVALLTPRSELQERRQTERWRLLAIGAGLLLSAAIVAALLWRQRQHEHVLRERLRHVEELNRLEHQLVRAEKLASVGVLAAGLAHELGTPLAIIRGRAEMLESKTALPEIKTILDQSDHIANTLRQVLDFSREQPVMLQPVDVRTSFVAVADLLDFRLRQKRVSLLVEVDQPSPQVAADPDQLQQVLVNLVLNACDACQEGGSIRLAASPDRETPGHIRIDVVDNGCGVPVGNLDAVFDPFFTTKPKGEGTGLGLPVVASIVRNHHGQISIASHQGAGTTVTVLWPEHRGVTA
jgi:signal transduction histidine kinase